MIIYLCPATKPGYVTLMADAATWDDITDMLEDAGDLARHAIMETTPRKPSDANTQRMTFTADMARYVQEIARANP